MHPAGSSSLEHLLSPSTVGGLRISSRCLLGLSTFKFLLSYEGSWTFFWGSQHPHFHEGLFQSIQRKKPINTHFKNGVCFHILIVSSLKYFGYWYVLIWLIYSVKDWIVSSFHCLLFHEEYFSVLGNWIKSERYITHSFVSLYLMYIGAHREIYVERHIDPYIAR